MSGGSIPPTCSNTGEDFPESLGVMNQAASHHTDVAETANAAGGELAKDGFDSHRSKRGDTFVGSNPTIWSRA